MDLELIFISSNKSLRKPNMDYYLTNYHKLIICLCEIYCELHYFLTGINILNRKFETLVKTYECIIDSTFTPTREYRLLIAILDMNENLDNLNLAVDIFKSNHVINSELNFIITELTGIIALYLSKTTI